MNLNFTIPFWGFSNPDFINVLSSVVLYLEGKTEDSSDYNCAKDTTGQFTGCGK